MQTGLARHPGTQGITLSWVPWFFFLLYIFQPILKQISSGCSLEGLMVKLKLQYFGYLMRRANSLEKTLMLGKIEGRREKGMTEDEMVGRHHRLNGHGFGWTQAVGDGQGVLACCDSWGRKELNTTEWLDWTELNLHIPEASNLPNSICFLYLKDQKRKSLTREKLLDDD